MRNIFDQYSQPENKLTHSLASCLYEDKRLLNSFLKRLLETMGRNKKHHNQNNYWCESFEYIDGIRNRKIIPAM